MRSLSCILLLYFTATAAWSQPDRFWYFGNEGIGIDWSGCEPEIVQGDVYGGEGMVTVSSDDGELLFYCNSDFVWNRNHQLMQNGELSEAIFNPIFGLTEELSTVSQLAVARQPGTDTYFVFTGDIQNWGVAPVRAWTIDMTQNGGLGAVVNETTLMTEPTAEKFISIPKSVGAGFWVVVKGYLNNLYHVWEVNEAGLNPTPQTFAFGTALLTTDFNMNATGEMRANLQGTQIAHCHRWLNGVVELLDFNPATGALTGITDVGTTDYGYGVSFSPDGSKLYIGEAKSFYPGPNRLIQFDLNNPLPGGGYAQTIIASEPNPSPFGSIKMAPNGKLYLGRAFSSSLSVINNPNELGTACDYEPNGFFLGTDVSRDGLNNIWEIAPPVGGNALLNLGPDISTCEPVSIGVDAAPGETYLWNTGDTTPTIEVTETGEYSLEVTADGCTLSGSVGVTFVTLELELEPMQLGCEPIMIGVEATPGFEYLWSSGETTSQILASESGSYVLLISSSACSQEVSFEVLIDFIAPVALDGPYTICEGDTLLLSINAPDADVLWSNGSTEPSAFFTSAGEVSVSVSNEACTRTANTTVVTGNAGAPLAVSGTQVLCEGDAFEIRLPAGWDQFIVNGDTLTDAAFTVSAGTYAIELINECAASQMEVVVEEEDCECPVFVPNAFSPDNDNINEVFRPYFDCDREYRLCVFNRWGECIYDSSREPLQHWNGSVRGGSYYAPADVYAWRLELFGDRERFTSQRLQGSVVLIR